MRTLIYLRQSLDKTGEELGVERQLAECQKLADARGLQVQEVITDNNRSATTGTRPGYLQVLDRIDRS